MANKPLKSIKFPGLSDTYTVPEVDDTLAVTGAAADAKKVGDEINDLKADLTHTENTLQYEFYRNITPTLTAGGYSGAVGSTIGESSDNNWKRFSVSVNEGERYKIHYRALGTSGAVTYIWLCDSNDIIKQVFQETTSTVKEVDRIVKIGSGISKIYVRSYTQSSGTQLSIMAENSAIDSIRAGLSELVEGSLQLDLSNIANVYPSKTIGSTISFNSSTASKTIKKIIKVKANTWYKLYIQENATPASTGNRECMVTDANNVIRQVISYTNTAGGTSIIEFTSVTDGYAYLCVDKNYVSISGVSGYIYKRLYEIGEEPTPIEFAYGYITTNDVTVDVTSVTTSTTWRYAVVDCSAGDEFIINAVGGNVPRAWCFIDSSGNSLSMSQIDVTVKNLIITAPSGSAKLIINDNSNSTLYKSYKGSFIGIKVSDVDNRLDAVETDMYGVESNIEMSTVSGLNLVANATKYTSSVNYTTYYIPCEKYAKYLYVFDNATANDQVVRLGFSKDIPANNVACKFIYQPAIPHTGTKTKTYEYITDDDGYLSVSFYTGAITTARIKQYADSTKIKANVAFESINAILASIDAINANIDDIEAELVDITLDYPIDALQFDIGGIYTQNNTWTYGTNAKRVRTKRGVALAVKKGTVVRSIDDDYQFALAVRRKNNTTFWVDWRTSPYDVMEDCEIGIGIRAYPTELTVEDVDSYVEAIEITPPSMYVNNNLDKRIQLSFGSYWGSPTLYSGTASDLTFSSSTSMNYAIVELTAGQLLKIVGRGATSSTRMYFTFRKDTGVLIDKADNSDNEGDSKVKFLRYDFDVTLYINLITTGEHYIQRVDQYDAAYYESMLTEHRMKTILDLNDPVALNMALRTLKRSEYGQTVPQVSLLHFSDLHGCDINLKRILDFANDATVSPYINNIIHTGDIFRSCLSDGYDWFNNLDGSEDILMAVGNHDTAKIISGTVTYDGASQEEVYTTLFDGKIENWGVVQPDDADTEFLSYYYKDYASSKLRLIVLDANRGASSEYTVAQLAWFEAVLQDAITLNYHVIVASHYIFDINASTRVNCSFCDWGSGQDGWHLYNAYAQKVEDFIDDGGTFVCWLAGHVHSDRVRMYNNRQLAIAVTTSSFESERTKYSQDQRVVGKKSQDAFNIVTIHTNASLLTLYRIGSDMGKYGNMKHIMTYDYANKEIVYDN